MLAHRLGVNAFFCALAEASRAHESHCLVTWRPEHWVRTRAAEVKPDGFGRYLHPGGACEFYLEFDRGTEAFGALSRKLEGYLRLAAGWTKEQELPGFPNLLLIVPEGVREGEIGSAFRHAIGAVHARGSLVNSFPLYVASEDRLIELGMLGTAWRLVSTDGERRSLVELPARPRDLYRAARCLGRYFTEAVPDRRRRIYLRVSTKEQASTDEAGEGYSIPAQRVACLHHIGERGWNVAGEFTDAGKSARTADRPMLKAMLRRVAEGGIGAVVVHKIDRLARSMEDHVAIRAALRHAGVQLVSVTENIEETASGRLVEGIHALMAEFYSANLAGEIRKGMTQKAKMGGWPTKAPIGYLNVREKIAGKEIAKVVLDPDRALLVREAFRLYATGDYSLPELQATMHAKGLTSPYARRAGAPVSVSKLAELLTTRSMSALSNGEAPAIRASTRRSSPRACSTVQETLRARDVAGVRQRRHEHYLKGLLHCGECGRRLSLTLAKGKYLYFYCLGQRGTARTGCRQPYILAGDAEAITASIAGPPRPHGSRQPGRSGPWPGAA